jgi:carbon starvation protein
VLLLDAKTWAALILAYCFVASLLPVWTLLQPRGYLGGFVLYLALATGLVGTFFGGFPIRQEAFKGVVLDNPFAGAAGSPLVPFLFVTIACGACSGFHGLVCSGTTSKQIARETHCKPVGYGAMLLEGFVAVIALATMMIVATKDAAGKGPGAIYGEGLGRFLTVVVGERHLDFAVTFGAMAFSTFIFDTLDVSTRLGRYIIQELAGGAGRAGALAVAATALTCGVPLAFILGSDPKAYLDFWTLFGTSNQLLAGLTLLGITVWLRRSGRRCWYTAIPMVFVLSITLWSLTSMARAKLLGPAGGAITRVNGALALTLIALAAVLVYLGAKALRSQPAGLGATSTSPGDAEG